MRAPFADTVARAEREHLSCRGFLAAHAHRLAVRTQGQGPFGNAADRPERRSRYGSDMNDAEWALVRDPLPVPGWPAGRGGRPEGSDVAQHEGESLGVVDLARSDDDVRRSAFAVYGVMDLGCRAPAGSAYCVARWLAPGLSSVALAAPGGGAGVLLRPGRVRGVLVGPVDRRVDRDRPVDPADRVRLSGQLPQNRVPGAVSRPSAVAFAHRLPGSERLAWQIAPGDSGAVPVDDPLDDATVAGERTPCLPVLRGRQGAMRVVPTARRSAGACPACGHRGR
jgi:hypothetical protein